MGFILLWGLGHLAANARCCNNNVVALLRDSKVFDLRIFSIFKHIGNDSMQFYSGVSWEGPACELKRDSISTQCIRRSNKIQRISFKDKFHLRTIWEESKWSTAFKWSTARTLHNFLQAFICRTTGSNGEILMSLFPLSLAESFPVKLCSFVQFLSGSLCGWCPTCRWWLCLFGLYCG